MQLHSLFEPGHPPPRGRVAAAVRRARRLGVLATCVLLPALLLAACSSKRPPASAATPRYTPALPMHPAASAHAANSVLMRAIGLVGTPYRWGGNTPEGGFDCSGLVGFVFRDAAGLALPRTTSDIARVPAPSLRREQLAAGDLVLFGERGRVDHIGIYVGDRRFVHAPSSGGTVRLDPLDGDYWQRRFISGRRLLR
jgi:cell wall-associated NlpC family hydrolase